MCPDTRGELGARGWHTGAGAYGPGIVDSASPFWGPNSVLVQAAITEYYRLGGINRNVSLAVLEAGRPGI